MLQYPLMIPGSLLLRFFDRAFMFQLIMLALLYSLVPLGEIFLIIYLGTIFGNYLTLATAALTSLVGMLIALRELRRQLALLKERMNRGEYPAEEFVSLAGILIGSIFLLTPGFITDLLGFLLFVPALRRGLGRKIVRRTQLRFKELYAYLKLYDL